MSSGKENGRYLIISVVESYKVLEAVANSCEPMGVADIARALSFTSNTVFRHCITLAEVGAITQVGDKYKLGMKLALYWARKRASLEAERERADRDLKSLLIEEE